MAGIHGWIAALLAVEGLVVVVIAASANAAIKESILRNFMTGPLLFRTRNAPETGSSDVARRLPGHKNFLFYEVYVRLHKAGAEVTEQGQTNCCYAKSEKSWVEDPSSISWEVFLTTGETTGYGAGSGERVLRIARANACCAASAALSERPPTVQPNS